MAAVTTVLPTSVTVPVTVRTGAKVRTGHRRSLVMNLYRSPRYHDCAHSTGSPVTS